MTFSSRYLKFILPLVLLLSCVLHMRAQNTATLAGTITDSNSQIWAGATWIATIVVPSGGTPMFISGGPVPRSYSGQLDSTGSFASGAVVGRNSQIVPAGTSWQFTLFSLTSAPAQVLSPNQTITGTTFAAGSILSALITPPVVQSSNQSFAYNTAEIVNAVNGNAYVNTISNATYLFNGASWVEIGGGAGCTGPTGNYALSGQTATLSSGCVAAIGNPFGATISCSQAGTRETGNSTTNPFACTFSYSNGTVASASLTDGTNTDTLSTPFTSGSLAFVYSSNHTFTVHATATNSQTASASTGLQFLPREFSGLSSTNGATGATSSGSTAVLVGATGTLASAGLGQQTNWGTFNPSSQYIYILGTGSACTFTSGGFNFPMASPVPVSFVNQYGSTVSMYMYISSNSLNVPFTILGTC